MARKFGQTDLNNLREVLRSKHLGWRQGGMVTRLDEAFANFTGAKYGICRNSAMTGLAQAVAISGAGCGDEVICDPLVHFGGVAALSFNCIPKFVDVKYDTYLMDPAAVEKAMKDARKNICTVTLAGNTISHEVVGRFGASNIVLVPARKGTGVIAGASARAVLELAGVQDVLTKLRGSTSPKNVVKATFDALLKLRSKEQLAQLRGVNVE